MFEKLILFEDKVVGWVLNDLLFFIDIHELLTTDLLDDLSGPLLITRFGDSDGFEQRLNRGRLHGRVGARLRARGDDPDLEAAPRERRRPLLDELGAVREPEHAAPVLGPGHAIHVRGVPAELLQQLARLEAMQPGEG